MAAAAVAAVAAPVALPSMTQNSRQQLPLLRPLPFGISAPNVSLVPQGLVQQSLQKLLLYEAEAASAAALVTTGGHPVLQVSTSVLNRPDIGCRCLFSACLQCR